MLEPCPKFQQLENSPPISIGGVGIRNRAFLAPMSGISDAPYRKLAWEFGAGMVISEMVASEALTTGQEEMRLKAESAGLPVHIVQLAGRLPQWMSEAAKLAQGAGADIIDINMGCPSKRVTTGYSGSALMRDLDHAMTLVEAVMETADVPVTLKMRLGWDDRSINAPELAMRAEAAGVSMITVHGRTRCQFYKGNADWNAVRQVRDRVKIPLLVNGDISSANDARAAMSASGADAVMIGRASYGAPWLPGQIGAQLAGQPIHGRPSGTEFAALVARHHRMMIEFYGDEMGVRNARKHLDWYLAHMPRDPELPQKLASKYQPLRQKLMTSRDPNEIQTMIEDLFSAVEPEALCKAEAA